MECKIDNVIKTVKFKDGDDLYWQLNDYLMHDPITDGRVMKLKQVAITEENTALVCMEEDSSVIPVQFIKADGEELRCSDFAFDTLLLPYQEIQLMNQLGTVTFEDDTYDIESLEYCINGMGGRYVVIKLA